MFPNLVPIPFRIADPVPLGQELTQLIKRDYFQPASSFTDDLERAQMLQNHVSAVSKDKKPNLPEYEGVLYEYYHLIGDISSKFPDNSVAFEWYGTLGHIPRHCAVSRWKSEQFQVVYQLGALYSNRACEESAHSDDGLKSACASFKIAAGFYDHLLAQNIEELSDFDKPTLLCLRWMMLALAQELIWQKAVTNTAMKDTVVARLSIKVSEFYGNSLEFANESEWIKLDWINHFSVKRHHFEAAAHYRMSVVAQDNFKYGEQVAHLRIASQLCDSALKYKRYVTSFVLEDLLGLTTTVRDSLRTAERDNDLVYLKPVPAPQDLAPILGVAMVDAEAPQGLVNRESFPPRFATLLPFSIIQVAQAFRERQDSFVLEHFHDPLQALTRMLSKFLAERDLPASIDTIQKPENLPDSIEQHSREIVSIGGTKIIESSMVEISKLAHQCTELVLACDERLRMEKYEDDLMRNREGLARWNRLPSLAAAAELSSRIDKMRGYLDQGRLSDLLIESGYTNIRLALEIYCGGRDALTKHIPRSNHIKLEPSLSKIVVELRELLAEVHKIETNRQRFISSLEVKSRNNSVLPLVLSEFKKNPGKFLNAEGAIEPAKFENVYERHIKFFNNDLKYLDLLKEQQMALEKKIHAVNLSLTQARSFNCDVSQQRRLEALQTFEEAYVQYLELISNLNHASRFYSDFLEKGSTVLRDADDFLYNRRELARELEISIRNQQKLTSIESSMTRGSPVPLAAPKGQKHGGSWDPSGGINFS